jgi:hypothetical protein
VGSSDLKRSKEWRFVYRVGFVLLGLIALTVILFLVRDHVKRGLENRIQADIADIRQKGEPVTAQEADKLYRRLPDAENSASVYLRACSNLVRLDISNVGNKNSPLLWILNNPSPSAPIPPETKTAMTEWLGSNRTAAALIHQGARIQEGRYPLDLTIFSGGSGRSLVRADASRLMAWEAILDAEEGDADEAFRSLNDSFALARSLRDHPCYGECQVRRELLFHRCFLS